MRVLSVNVGSSSLKMSLWEADCERPDVEFEARNIGGEGGTLVENGKEVARATFDDHLAALTALFERFSGISKISRIGHRVVHGGPFYRSVVWLDELVLRDLEVLVPLSPLHQPPALAVMHECRRRFPNIPQAAVFDTAFHATLPAKANTYAVPATWRDAGVRRYGFHGIACADIVAQLGTALRQRAVFLHLGAGCSVTAVLHGKSVDTTMGFTPLEGLVMVTRSGDIDPGVLLYMQRERGLTAEKIDHMLNHESGLLALTGSMDMTELLQRDDEQAILAVELFCFRAAKAVAAMAGSLGGVDQLVFSGGIGEHAAVVRGRIVAQLAWLGAVIDDGANEAGEAVISVPDSAVEVRVLSVDEGRQISRETMALSVEG